MALLRYTKKDLFLVLLGVLQFALWLTVLCFFSELSYLHLGLASLLIAALICTNFQCVAHNFIHNPFFEAPFFNYLFSLMNTVNLGVPQTYYHAHHMNHHKYNNDRKKSEGTTQDESSIYRHGKGGEPEWILAYSLLSYFRVNFVGLYKGAVSFFGKFVVVETLFLVAFLVVLLILSPKGFVFYLVTGYLGNVLANMENYFEHFGAPGTNRKNDSVSCYNKIYNFLWFNNGYHQEHHYGPKVHWTMISKVKRSVDKEEDRRIVPYAHFMNF